MTTTRRAKMTLQLADAANCMPGAPVCIDGRQPPKVRLNRPLSWARWLVWRLGVAWGLIQAPKYGTVTDVSATGDIVTVEYEWHEEDEGKHE